MAFSSRAVSAPSARGGQQVAARPAARLALPLPPPRSRRGRSPLVSRAAIEAPRPSSPQPPQQRSPSSVAASASEISSNAAAAATLAAAVAGIGEDKKRESVLCTRLAGAHSKAVTALLVLNDRDDVKEIVTASLDKTVALWRLVESGQGGDSDASTCDAPPASPASASSSASAPSSDPLCSSAAALVARLGAACGDDAARAPVFALAADVDGAADAARLERILANSSSSSSAGEHAAAAAAAKRPAEASSSAAVLDAAAAAPAAAASPSSPPSSSSSSSSSAPLLLPRLPTVFIGGGTPSVRGWQPAGSGSGSGSHLPASVPDVVLEGHAGWVRSLAASGRWLFSCGCGGIKQWDLSRAVPRCVATVSLPRGDVSALAATPTALFAGGADGSLCAWRLPTSRRNEGGVGALKKDAPPDAVVPAAHSARVSALAVVGGGGRSQVVSASHDGSIALWSLCAAADGSGGGLGLGEEGEAEECCVTHAEQEAAAASAATATTVAEAEAKKAAPRAKLVEVSRLREAHGVAAAADEAAAPAAVAAAVSAVAPASDASIPAPPAPPAPPAAAAAAVANQIHAAVANKIHAAVVGRDGLLYTGGDDGLVARWVISSSSSSTSAAPPSSSPGDGGSSSPSSPPPLAPAASGPLHGHGGSPVRALAAGPGDALVSGDAAGNVLLWRL